MNPEPKEDGTALLELELDLRDRLRIDPLALEKEFIEIPAQIAYFGAVYGRSIGEHLRAEIRRKKLWGLVVMQARDDLEIENDRAAIRETSDATKENRKPKDVKIRITESMVESRAQQSKLWEDAQLDEARAEVHRETSKSNLAAILAKKDMLIQMGANARAEMERDPIIRDRIRVNRDG
jgi:hypothetical protein